MRLDPHWQLQFGIHAGNDMAPWQSSAAPNGQLLVRWVSSDNNDSFLGGINSIGDGEFRHEHDNLQMIGGTWGHRFSDRFHMMTEWYYMWQFNAAAGGSCVDAGNHTFAFGGGCGSIIPGRSDAVGLVNYFQTYLGPNDYLSFRNDYLNDPEGQRSGFRTAYTSHTLGFIHYFTPWLSTRPELRFEHAWMHGQTPYDLGTKQNQFTFGADVIIRY